jgi:tetratricopeptide (TPR) repeat protein
MVHPMRRLRLPALLYSLWSVTVMAAQADDIGDGQKLYRKGKFVEASAYFSRAVDSNNYDATAHYFLGNCFMQEKNYAKASTEYQRAMEFTDDSTMEQYCRDALDKLKPFIEPKSVAASKSHTDSQPSTTGAESKMAKVREIIERSHSAAKDIMARAEERCKPILQEKGETLRTMNIVLRRRIETTTAEERSDVTREYDSQVASIRNLAKQQAEAVLEQGRRDAASVGQGLPNLDELLAK